MLVSLAAAIALGATSMSDIALLAHLAPVLGDAPGGPAVRRALDLAGTAAMLDRIARARARARAHVRTLIEGTPAGFPWLAIAGKTLTGWLVTGMDATLVTASSDKEGAAPTWKKGYDLLGAWLAKTRECLAMLLRPGNAGSNTFTDHKEVLAAALRQVIAANIAADLTAWTRLLGLYDIEDLREAEPDTLRYRVWHIPARLARHARQRILKISPRWPWKKAFPTCWQRLCVLPAPA